MDRDREYLIQHLAHQILGMRAPDGSRPVPSSGVTDAASATVSIELAGLVQRMRHQLWIDTSAWTAKIVAEIERQAAEIDLDKVVAAAVAREISRTLAEIDHRVREEVSKLVGNEIRERLAKFPERLARKLAGKLWDEAWAAEMKDGG
jgi:hypothetical protein